MEPFNELAGILGRTGVRYLVIGVGGANYYAPAASASFVTLDCETSSLRRPRPGAPKTGSSSRLMKKP